MESIRKAIERAKGRLDERSSIGISYSRQTTHGGGNAHGSDVPSQGIELDPAYLESRRIIAYDGNDPRSRFFDILRTQVLQTLAVKGYKILAITSPTPGCGKTLTAINLALCMARQSERQVLLVDTDLRKPQVAACLGLMRDEGLFGVLEGHITATGAIVKARIGNCKFEVLPTASTSLSSDLMGSSAMSTFLRDIGRQGQSRIVILDLPPVLTSDDVMAILPQVDCALLVAAVGTSTVAEIKECSRHLQQSTDLIRLVLNKAPESSAVSQYY